MILQRFRRQSKPTPQTLSLEELLEGVNVGDYRSWYEHELFGAMQRRYETAVDKQAFLTQEVPALPGYDAVATEAIYRRRNIHDAFVFRLPDVEHFDCPACVLYRLAHAPHQWSIIRFYEYDLIPNFYEPLDLHDFNGWGLLAHYPDGDGWSPPNPPRTLEERRRLPRCKISNGTVVFPVLDEAPRHALSYASDLEESMASLGVLCEPELAIGYARDHDPYRHPSHCRSEEEPHPYARTDDTWAWDTDSNPDAFYEMPPNHRVIPNAGPAVPSQRVADDMAGQLASWSFWTTRRNDLQGRLEDPAIPARRRPMLLEQWREAAQEAREHSARILADPESILGLILSLENAVETMADAIHPLLFAEPGFKYNPGCFPALQMLHNRLGRLFDPAEHDKPTTDENDIAP